MKRRSFLVGASTLALAQMVAGCNNQQRSLSVTLLQDSIPAQLRKDFQKVLKQPARLRFDLEAQLQDLFNLLQIWKQEAGKTNNQQWSLPFIGNKTPAIANLVTLGDYWLEQAIQEKLIQPLGTDGLKGWQQLPPRWQELVLRNSQGQLDKSGQVWGAPYRWGTTVIAYNREKFENLGWTPQDWSDLWRPQLRDRISLLDQPREVIGLVLKKLGASYNTADLSQVPDLKNELLALHQQVKFYSSDNYLQPLLLGDTWVTMGWSADVLPAVSSYHQLKAVVPSSGTALWSDVWVQPASTAADSDAVGTGDSASIAKQWIDFCWQSKPALELSIFSPAVSPMITAQNRATLPKDLRDNRLLLPDASVLDKSEFIQPLPKTEIEQYQALWQEIRQSKSVSSKQ